MEAQRRERNELAGESILGGKGTPPPVAEVPLTLLSKATEMFLQPPTRGRAGPAKFLEGYKGYLQADAYSVYDAFFKGARGLVEVGCWMHARRFSSKLWSRTSRTWVPPRI